MNQDHQNYFAFMKTLKSLIVPYISPFKKIRIGPIVIADMSCDVCYLYRYGCTILLENILYEKYGAKSFKYDNTMDTRMIIPPHITFKPESLSRETTLETHITENVHGDEKEMFLYINIEGQEWSILLSESINHFNKFKQVVIELHFYGLPFTSNDLIIEAIRNLLLNFKIIHLNAKSSPIVPYVDFEFPKVVEITLLRNDMFKTLTIDNVSPYPDPDLDTDTVVTPIRWWKTSPGGA